MYIYIYYVYYNIHIHSVLVLRKCPLDNYKTMLYTFTVYTVLQVFSLSQCFTLLTPTQVNLCVLVSVGRRHWFWRTVMYHNLTHKQKPRLVFSYCKVSILLKSIPSSTCSCIKQESTEEQHYKSRYTNK